MAKWCSVPIVLLGLLSGCLCSAVYGQSAASLAPKQLHDSRHFGSEALACNGLSGLVIERTSFLFVRLGYEEQETAVHRVSLDGTSDTKFDVRSIVRPFELADRTPYIGAFTSSTSGDVFVMTRWIRPRVSEVTNIVRFDSHGMFQEVIPLDIEGVQVLHMARFLDGKFIMIAGEVGNGGLNTVDMVIISADGKVVVRKPLRKLSEAEKNLVNDQRQRQLEAMKAKQELAAAGSRNPDDKDGKPQQQKTPQAAVVEDKDKHPGQEIEQLFFRSRLTPSEDGGVYLIRPDKQEILFHISNDGTVTERSLKKNTYFGTSSRLDNLLIYDGQAILFSSTLDGPPDPATPRHTTGVQVDTFNIFSGEPTGRYTGDAKVLGTIAVGWSSTGPSYARFARTAQPPGFEIVAATY